MQYPVQVTFRDMSISDAIEAACWEEAEKLERYCPRLTSCRVVVAESHRRRRQGNLFEIRIDLTLPGTELVVNREPPAHAQHEDVQVAIRESFDTARRLLKKHVEKAHGVPRQRETPPVGRVCKLFPEESYGFIEADDDHEIYFHRHSVLNDAFDSLELGDEVRYAEESGVHGPQASTVHLVGKHSSTAH